LLNKNKSIQYWWKWNIIGGITRNTFFHEIQMSQKKTSTWLDIVLVVCS